MTRPLVVTVGDLVLDVTCRPRDAVRRGTDTATQVVVDAGGQAANAAAWAVQAGARARLLARRAADHVGRLAEERIALRGVEAAGPLGRTGGGAIVVLVGADGERDMLSDRGEATALAASDLAEELLDGAGAVLVTGYCLAVEPMLGAARRAAALAHASGAALVTDLSSEALIDAVGVAEFARRVASLSPDVLLGTTPEHALLGGVSRTLELAPTVVEKRGRSGARLHTRRGEPVDVPAVAVTAVDTTGAGDALAGGMLAAIAAGAAPEAALRSAMPFAARCVAGVGSLPPVLDGGWSGDPSAAILPPSGTPDMRT